jgi:dimethylglycine dehydrogenase
MMRNRFTGDLGWESLALGFVVADVATPGRKFSISLLGRPHEALLLDKPLFDPAGARLRS